MKELLKKEKTVAIFVVSILFLGTIMGAFFMATSNFDDTTKTFLEDVFLKFEDKTKHSVFLNSFYDNLRIFITVFALSFFKFGSLGIFGASLLKGFVTGFTTAAFVKYYSVRGLLVPLASFFSNVIFIPTFIIFLVCSVRFSYIKKTKNNILRFFCLSSISLAIFCVSALLDGYLGTTFMNLLKGFIVKM